MIIIFDEDKHIYNIGDLLNMPHFSHNWNNNPHDDKNIYNKFIKTAEYYKGSVLNIYKTTRENENNLESIPNINRLRLSVDKFSMENNIKSDLTTDLDSETLYIHLRSGDKGIVESLYLKKIKYLSEKYKYIIILVGIHMCKRVQPLDKSKKNLEMSLNKIKDMGIEFTVDYNSPDHHLCLMRNCKNLLVHKGGFSILGSLLFQGDNLYLTSLFHPKHPKCSAIKNNKFIKYLNNYQMLKNNES